MRGQVLKYHILVLMLLNVLSFTAAARAQGGDCTQKTFNMFVSWAKKNDVKSFSSRIGGSGGLHFSTQKQDPAGDRGQEEVFIDFGNVAKEFKTKNSSVYAFFTAHLPNAKFSRAEDQGMYCVLIGSLSKAWEIFITLEIQREGYSINGFGYQKPGFKIKAEESGNPEEGSENTEESVNTDEGSNTENESGNTEEREVLVEYQGQWYPAVILEQKNDKYLIHYHDYDSSWDEWVTKDRIKEKE